MAPHVNGRLNWEQVGKHGPPMVFIHPNPMDHTCWLYQMAHLQTWFRCIGVDLPGYGRSPTAEEGLTMPDVAQACWEAVDEAAPGEPAILVGLSVGSTVIQYMAHQRPRQTSALVIAGHGYRPVKPKMFVRAEQYETLGVEFRRQHALEDYGPAFRETRMAAYFADMFQERNPWADARTIAIMFRALGQPDPDWLSRGLRAPTLIISGSEDNAHQVAFDLQKMIPDCEMVTIEGAGHACNMEQPWAFDAHLLEFLDRRGVLPRVAAPAGVRGG